MVTRIEAPRLALAARQLDDQARAAIVQESAWTRVAPGRAG
jgi:hypothetical protein